MGNVHFFGLVAKLPRKPATFGIATGTMSMQDNTSNQPPEEDEEEDYMNMVIAEPTVPQKETSIQRRQRQKREAEIRGCATIFTRACRDCQPTTTQTKTRRTREPLARTASSILLSRTSKKKTLISMPSTNWIRRSDCTS